MYINKKINCELYPLSEYLFERKYVPCFCKIKPGKFEITFTADRLDSIKLEVQDFDIEKLGLYASIGVGGEWWIYQDALVTLRRNSENPEILEFLDLAFFELLAGWFWAIKDGVFTKDYIGKDEDELPNSINYPLQE